MHEIENDYFYDFVKQYDPDSEYYIVGEVEYHLLTDNKPYEGLRSHRDALIAVFDHLHPLVYDINKAQSKALDQNNFFYCPKIVKTDYYGNVFMMPSGSRMTRILVRLFHIGTHLWNRYILVKTIRRTS
jgi:hypothetical protein